MVLVVKITPCNAGNVKDAGSIPRLGRSPGEGNNNPLQHSCLENPMVGLSPWGRKEWDSTEVTEHQLHHTSRSAGPPDQGLENPITCMWRMGESLLWNSDWTRVQGKSQTHHSFLWLLSCPSLPIMLLEPSCVITRCIINT